MMGKILSENNLKWVVKIIFYFIVSLTITYFVFNIDTNKVDKTDELMKENAVLKFNSLVAAYTISQNNFDMAIMGENTILETRNALDKYENYSIILNNVLNKSCDKQFFKEKNEYLCGIKEEFKKCSDIKFIFYNTYVDSMGENYSSTKCKENLMNISEMLLEVDCNKLKEFEQIDNAIKYVKQRCENQN